jgi:phosphate starvation-inducible PhoH-like protein
MELTIQVASPEEAMALFGPGDRNLKILRDAFKVQLTGRGTTLRLSGEKEPLEKVAGLLNGLVSLHRSGARIPRDYLEQLCAQGGAAAPAVFSSRNGGEPGRALDGGASSALAHDGPETGSTDVPAAASPRGSEAGAPPTSLQGLARSRGQEVYVQAMLHNEMVFCIGPAGTGKTFLAVRMAVSFLRQGGIRKIILCRPAVEAGEKLGFLPGDFQAKINPYLRPLYDALNDILDYDQVKRYLEREIIEILPLAYMRGRTLNNSFIILDEGQNTSVSQMKMFLTRMGTNSRIVVNGDITQLDLPDDMQSGLIHARRIIRDIPGISWVELERADIVRHPLVKRIVEAYEGSESSAR